MAMPSLEHCLTIWTTQSQTGNKGHLWTWTKSTEALIIAGPPSCWAWGPSELHWLQHWAAFWWDVTGVTLFLNQKLGFCSWPCYSPVFEGEKKSLGVSSPQLDSVDSVLRCYDSVNAQDFRFSYWTLFESRCESTRRFSSSLFILSARQPDSVLPGQSRGSLVVGETWWVSQKRKVWPSGRAENLSCGSLGSSRTTGVKVIGRQL